MPAIYIYNCIYLCLICVCSSGVKSAFFHFTSLCSSLFVFRAEPKRAIDTETDAKVPSFQKHIRPYFISWVLPASTWHFYSKKPARESQKKWLMYLFSFFIFVSSYSVASIPVSSLSLCVCYFCSHLNWSAVKPDKDCCIFNVFQQPH